MDKVSVFACSGHAPPGLRRWNNLWCWTTPDPGGDKGPSGRSVQSLDFAQPSVAGDNNTELAEEPQKRHQQRVEIYVYVCLLCTQTSPSLAFKQDGGWGRGGGHASLLCAQICRRGSNWNFNPAQRKRSEPSPSAATSSQERWPPLTETHVSVPAAPEPTESHPSRRPSRPASSGWGWGGGHDGK